jgi:hypothetical protein
MGLPVVAVGLALAAARLAGASVAGHLVPGHRAALATAPPLLVAGIGSGFVILSNQALTLAEVPPVAGGSAAGVPQAGQRIGSAVGIAAGGSVFFSSHRHARRLRAGVPGRARDHYRALGYSRKRTNLGN